MKDIGTIAIIFSIVTAIYTLNENHGLPVWQSVLILAILSINIYALIKILKS